MPVRRKYNAFTRQCMFCDLIMEGPKPLQGKRISQYEAFDRIQGRGDSPTHGICPECRAEGGEAYFTHAKARMQRDRRYARRHPEHKQAIENTAEATTRELEEHERKRLKRSERSEGA